MSISYYVCGIGYDKNNCVTDDEWSFGDFGTYEEAYEFFKKLQRRDETSFFTENESNVCQMLLQLEECEVTNEITECICVRNEWWVNNPNYKDTINEKDIHYSYDTKGYMLYYKDKPIGGAGIDKYAKGCRSNLKLFKQQAEYDKRAILSGYGEKRYLKCIAEIEEETK